MKQWESIRPEWYAYLQAHGPGIVAMHSTATRGLLALWRASYAFVITRIGKLSGTPRGPTGSNKTIRRLRWAIKNLTYVINEQEAHRPVLESSEGFRRAKDLCYLDIDLVYERHQGGGPRPPLEKSKWDPIWQKAFSYDAFDGVNLSFPERGFT
eukprot:3920911-Rhodomonas_salina.1